MPTYLGAKTCKKLVLLFLFIYASVSRPLTVDDTGVILDNGVICRPSKSLDILIFFVTNYFSHVLTVRSEQGAGVWRQAFLLLSGLLWPFTGIFLAIHNISRAGILGRGNLGKAVRSHAIYTVVRSKKWCPRPGERLRILARVEKPVEEVALQGTDREDDIKPSDSTDSKRETNLEPKPARIKLHTSTSAARIDDTGVVWFQDPIMDPENCWIHFFGRVTLPPGYALMCVSPFSRVEDSVYGPIIEDNDAEEAIAGLEENADCPVVEDRVFDPQNGKWARKPYELACSDTSWKSIFSLVQIIAAVYSLSKASVLQFEKYGYASYALTTLPYIIMSAINLLANVLTYEYPTCYIVRSEAYDEAKRRFPDMMKVECMVGRIVHLKEEERENSQNEHWKNLKPVIVEGLEGCGVQFRFENPTDDDDFVRKGKTKIREKQLREYRVEEEKAKRMTVKALLPRASTFAHVKEAVQNINHQQLGSKPILRRASVSESICTNSTCDSFVNPVPGGYVVRIPPVVPSFASSKERFLVRTITRAWFSGILIALCFALPYILIHAFTRFSHGSSSVSERAWMMSWLAANQFFGMMGFGLFNLWVNETPSTSKADRIAFYVVIAITATLAVAPALGGLIVVGKMIARQPWCTEYD